MLSWFILAGILLDRELYFEETHCVKKAQIWSFSGPSSVRMRENKDQKNSEYGQFSRSDHAGNFTKQLLRFR